MTAVPGPRLVLGDPAAPITVTEFGDLECPYCRAAEPVLRELVETSQGQVRLEWRHFPLFQVHPHALIAALAAEAAAEQGLFWQMQRALFAQQDHLAEPDLRAVGARLGLDPARVAGEQAQTFADLVEADYLAGLELGIRGTPTLLVQGERYHGPIELGPLRAAVAAVVI
jgi:protein-disulfide isomerase